MLPAAADTMKIRDVYMHFCMHTEIVFLHLRYNPRSYIHTLNATYYEQACAINRQHHHYFYVFS